MSAPSPAPAPAPLAGIKVLDLSRVLAGPFCGTILGDLGAEVVKVEHPVRGDDTRGWGRRIGATETTYYNSVNRNKFSLALDLTTSEGASIVRDLAAQSDVVIQNFRPGDAEKLGLAPARLRATTPGLVCCTISGYDSPGPDAARPGYDLVIQGEAGLMALNGEAGRPPLKFGVAAVDMFTGMYAAQAVMAALIQRGRTGQGSDIRLALFDCGLTLTTYYGLEALLTGEEPPRYGNAHPSVVPYGVFDAADGPLVITIGTDAQFARFCNDVLARPDLAADARHTTNILRAANRATLLPTLEAELARHRRADLLVKLAANGIPCGEVLALGEALNSPRAQAAGMVTTHAHPAAPDVHILAPPYRFDGARSPVRHRPPLLGEHSEAILRERLGKTPGEIGSLRAAGVLHQ
jgi:crotonobetainyl-CoA:carnitine CoA-transferase CaiB-like acyl-CoA transferase